jgi:putative CocE/NonD family hydrolase
MNLEPVGSDMVVQRDVMIPMRDGVRLATDIYLPALGGAAIAGRFPVILERTPYDKSGISRSERTAADPEPTDRAETARFFVRHGYAVIYQDCRGRYGSEGSFRKYLDDGADGYDTVVWLAAQPWSTGRIGTMGLSYAAHTQVALGCLDPPGLACQVIDSGGFSNAYRSGIRQGGAFELKQATWAYRQALVSPEAEADPKIKAALEAEDIKAWFTRMPWKRGYSPLQWVPDYEDYLFDQWTHGRFDDFWRQLGIYAEGHYEHYADVPMIHISSWYDAYTETATTNYLGLARAGRQPVHLILGPWTHGDRSVTFAGDVDFGPAATLDGAVAPDFRHLRLAWFDRWLKPEGARATGDLPAVQIFVMGGGSGARNAQGRLDHGGAWRAETGWPLPGTQWLPFYLHDDGRLAPELPAPGTRALSYDFDPRKPVPSIGGTMTSGAPVMEGGAYDQVEDERFFGSEPPYLPLASRADILVFATPPLEHDLEITGPITVRLWISSDCPDTDFTAKLIDQYPASRDYPHGFAMNITDGILRVRYRASWEQPSLLEPEEIVEISITPFPTSNLFKAGHRLRLDISSSNFPHFDVNPNAGEAEGVGQRVRIAQNTVHVDREHPSHILLPVVARG